ncbi:MAG: hypothetical protein GC154_09825 [bacterium]|nr:hypothetical protein [bacterium]
MKRWSAWFLIFILSVTLAQSGRWALGQTADERADSIRNNRLYFLPHQYANKFEWLQRRERLIDDVRVAMGCMPWPEKTPLNPHVFDRLERDGYTIEKVYFESFPGVYVTGNLYRPAKGRGPYPAILSPHGHWGAGRLADEETGSVPARAIHFARHGIITFNYDMVGYVDSKQIGHDFGGEREWLWGLSLHGLQFWNSIRAIDFLTSLPDVDPDRIGCTGASGGGTQTFFLTAVDNRVKVSAPVNMISSRFQGGCLCENAPALRLEANNMEYGALMAPRPLLMVSASGDWTTETPLVEYPAIRSIYRLYGADDALKTVQIDSPHNYNQRSREQVYGWFDHWLNGKEGTEPEPEEPYSVEKPEDVRVFPNGLDDYPPGAKNGDELLAWWIGQSEKQLAATQPDSELQLSTLRNRGLTVLRHAMNVEVPSINDLLVERPEPEKREGYSIQQYVIQRKGKGDRVEATLLIPTQRDERMIGTLLVHPQAQAALMEGEGENIAPGALAQRLLERGHEVMIVNVFNSALTPENRGVDSVAHFFTYNPSDVALRVQDILTAYALLNGRFEVERVQLAGFGEGGLWTLLAAALAPELDSVVIDAAGFDSDDDFAYLKRLFVPHLRRAGDVRMAQAVIAPAPLLIHDTAGVFQTDWAERAYRTLNASGSFKSMSAPAGDDVILDWLN